MSPRPRVFHLITRLLRGGATGKTLGTVFRLDDEYEFTIGYGAEYSSEVVSKLNREDIRHKRFQLIRHNNPVTPPLAVLSVAKHVREEDYDIIHTHSTEAGIIGRISAALAGVPVIVHTVHGVPFTSDRSNVLNRFVLSCERTAAPLTDVMIANADAIADDYLSRSIGTPEQYQTVYSGIDVDAFARATPANLPGSGVRVLMAARLVEGKGFGVLLDAIEKIDRRDFHVCIAGEGPLRDSLEAEINGRGLDEMVDTLGFRDDMSNVYAASDILVLPSYREGTPRVITEALASGLPVIATDVAGVPEQVEDGVNGFLIQPGDVDGLVDKLQKLIHDREMRESFGQESRQRSSTFSAERMAETLDDIYREHLGG